MNDPFDTRAIPDDADYWDALTARAIAAAGRPSASALDWLARSRAAALTVLIVLIAAGVALFRAGAAAPRESSARAEWTPLLSPQDPVGRTIATGERPPAVARLLTQNRASGK